MSKAAAEDTYASHARPEWGIFHEAPYVTVGDPYVEYREPPVHQVKGVPNFRTNPGKRGQTGSNWGGKTSDYKPAWVGDPYIDPRLVRRRQRQSGRQFLTPEGFRFPSPAKKRSGSGDCYGSFTEKHLPMRPLRPASNDQHGSARKKVTTEVPRNIVATSDTRNGTGPNCRTITGEPFVTLRESANEAAREARRRELEHHHRMVGGRKPFVSAAAPLFSFWDREHAVVEGGKVFTRDGKALPLRTFPEDTLTRKEIAERRYKLKQLGPGAKGTEAVEARPPFRPPHPAKSGQLHGALTKPYQYVPDEYDTHRITQSMLPSRRLPEKLRTQRLPESVKSRPKWRDSNPVSKKTKPTRSIALGMLRASVLSRGGRR